MSPLRPGELKVNCTRCHENDRSSAPVFMRKDHEDFVPFSDKRKLRVDYVCDVCGWTTSVVFEKPAP